MEEELRGNMNKEKRRGKGSSNERMKGGTRVEEKKIKDETKEEGECHKRKGWGGEEMEPNC